MQNVLRCIHYLTGSHTALCCGIVGYTGFRDASPILLNGVVLLQNRGYDSVGVSTINEKNELLTTKCASKGTTSDCVETLCDRAPKVHSGHMVGIAHTRWATHGAKVDSNAHPHSDYQNRISLVHNGTIHNFASLREELINMKITFASETDSEVIANLIGLYLDRELPFDGAVAAAVDRLQGTWGIVVIHKNHPDVLMVARNGSPLLIGSELNEVFVASEPLALSSYTNHYLPLDDGEIVKLTRKSGINKLVHQGRTLQRCPMEQVQLSPDPYDHWTLKEIMEQRESLSRALSYGGRVDRGRPHLGGLQENRAVLSEIENMIIIGCGTSLYAGHFGALLMTEANIFTTVQAIDATEFHPHSLNRKCETFGVLSISQSGETLDTIKAAEHAKNSQAKVLSIVNVVGSYLARLTGCGVYLNAGRETAVASTKAFTSQVLVLCLVTSWFSIEKRGKNEWDRGLVRATLAMPDVAGTILEDCYAQCEMVGKRLSGVTSMFLLGKGLGHPVALEGALKIKEISYVHAEGFAAGQLKHGPFAMLDEAARTPVLLIILRDQHEELMMTTYHQVTARHATTIVITDCPALFASTPPDHLISIVTNGILTALCAVIPIQLIAYHTAIAKGLSPDKPRGLAKTVTTN